MYIGCALPHPEVVSGASEHNPSRWSQRSLQHHVGGCREPEVVGRKPPWHRIWHTSHMAHITSHMAHIAHHMAHLTPHISHITYGRCPAWHRIAHITYHTSHITYGKCPACHHTSHMAGVQPVITHHTSHMAGVQPRITATSAPMTRRTCGVIVTSGQCVYHT